MGLFDFWGGKKKENTPVEAPPAVAESPAQQTPAIVAVEVPEAAIDNTPTTFEINDVTHYKRPLPTAVYGGDFMVAGGNTPITTVLYSGEKNFGEMGPVIKNVLDHDKLGRRAWDAYLKDEVVANITKKKTRFKVGRGLHLDAEPKNDVLQLFGINLTEEQIEEFNKKVESLWSVYANTPGIADYANRVPLGKIATRADINASNRGDVLIILRVDENDMVKVQLIDGEHVSTPVGLSTISNTGELVDNHIGFDYVWKNGNRIRNGVEIDDTGAHVAYHVRNGIGLEWKRIAARNRFGSLIAYLYTGQEFRLDNTRGIPHSAQVMESGKQLDEYTSAAVSSAVERARIAYTIEHEVNAEGLDPRINNMLKVVGGTRDSMDLPVDVNGEELAREMAISTNKQTFNMPPGSKVNALDSKSEIRYKEFFETRENSMSASMDVPPEVARNVFTSSYSASRGAMNLFAFILGIERGEMGDGFYQPIYNLQLDMWVLRNKIDAPGYIEAMRNGNKLILGAYRHANWEGQPLPEIDELNSVKAARLMLGEAFDHVPLSTVEKQMKKLGTGNYRASVVQAGEELKEAGEYGIEPKQKGVPLPEDKTDGETPDDKEKKKEKEDENDEAPE